MKPVIILQDYRFLHFFLMGFLLADVYLIDWNESPTRHLRWDLVSLVGWPALFLIWSSPELSDFVSSSGNGPVLEVFFFPLCTFVLYCAVFRGLLTNRILTNPWVTTIGGMCYTIYLFHNKLIGLIIEVTKHIAPTGSYVINLSIQVLLVIPLVVMISAAYFMVIERPCMRKDWPVRLWHRARQAVAWSPRDVASKVAMQKF